MKLTHLRIHNFRSCRDVSLELGWMHVLVGANNAGKSAVLRALDFLFNPSTKSLNEESFWSKDTSLEIRVEAVFSDLIDKEKEALAAEVARLQGEVEQLKKALKDAYLTRLVVKDV